MCTPSCSYSCLQVPFAIVSDDNSYEMSCVEPWEQDGRRVYQFSPSKFKQMRDVAEVEKIILSYRERTKEVEVPEDVQGAKGDGYNHDEQGEDMEPPKKKLKISFLPWLIRNFRTFFDRFLPG